MYLAFAGMLLAIALLTVAVTRMITRSSTSASLDREQLSGFLYVGAAALGALLVAVVVVGALGDDRGIAEAVALLGLLGYFAYLLVTVVIVAVLPNLRLPQRPLYAAPRPPRPGSRTERLAAESAARELVALDEGLALERAMYGEPGGDGASGSPRRARAE